MLQENNERKEPPLLRPLQIQDVWRKASRLKPSAEAFFRLKGSSEPNTNF